MTKRSAYNVLVEEPERRRSLGRLDLDRRLILKQSPRNMMGGCGLDSYGSG
jgi:hypothetical protein